MGNLSNAHSPIPANPNQWIDKSVVTDELIKYFKTVLDIITDPPLNGSLRNDCAVICAFLQSTPVFDTFYIKQVDGDLRKAYEKAKLALQENPHEKRKGGALLHAFNELMKPFGFVPLKGIVFTGDAAHISDITGSRLLFKDATGPTHGEFTHSLQWLTICYLVKNNPPCLQGHKLVNQIGDIYSILMKYQIHRIDKNGALQNDVTNSADVWPGEVFFGKKDTRLPDKQKYLWDFVVDAFAASDRQGAKMADEITLSNLYTDTYRCPAKLLIAIQSGTLQKTFIGTWWENRTVKYSKKPMVKPKRPWNDIENYRPMVAESQQEKGKHQFGKNEWAAEDWRPVDFTVPPDGFDY
jgi:hypothetical protein